MMLVGMADQYRRRLTFKQAKQRLQIERLSGTAQSQFHDERDGFGVTPESSSPERDSSTIPYQPVLRRMSDSDHATRILLETRNVVFLSPGCLFHITATPGPARRKKSGPVVAAISLRQSSPCE
jgi:hypothetical protein